jgi:hypothetical protein
MYRPGLAKLCRISQVPSSTRAVLVYFLSPIQWRFKSRSGSFLSTVVVAGLLSVSTPFVVEFYVAER